MPTTKRITKEDAIRRIRRDIDRYGVSSARNATAIRACATFATTAVAAAGFPMSWTTSLTERRSARSAAATDTGPTTKHPYTEMP